MHASSGRKRTITPVRSWREDSIACLCLFGLFGVCECATKFDFRAWTFSMPFLYILRFAVVRACGQKPEKSVRGQAWARAGSSAGFRGACTVFCSIVVVFLQFCDPTCVAGSWMVLQLYVVSQ